MLPESRVERVNNTFFMRRSCPNSLQMLGEDLVEDLAAEVRFSRERLSQLERKKLRRNARLGKKRKWGDCAGVVALLKGTSLGSFARPLYEVNLGFVFWYCY